MQVNTQVARRNIWITLNEAGFEDARLEADIIMEWVTGFSRAEQILNDSVMLTSEQSNTLLDIVSRRLNREPLDHIMGYRQFYGLEFKINKNVLSPRPETERLVDYIIEATDPGQKLRILDMGTGTGAIPIAILKARRKFTAVASDISLKALEVAEQNSSKHGVSDRIKFIVSDWFEKISGQFDYIVSNPPYIASGIIETLSPEVKKFDPILALDGGPDGLAPYRIIAAQASCFLKPHGVLALEIGYDQGTSVPGIFKQNGFTSIQVEKDLSGHDRIIIVAK